MLAALPEVGRAQCPDGTWTPASVTEIIPGTTCTATVGYCWKVEGGVLHYIIEWVYAAGTDACAALTPSQIIKGATAAFEADPIVPDGSGVHINPCGGTTTTLLRFTIQACWAVHNSFGPGDPRNPPNPPCYYCSYFGACTGGSSACETDCEYCQDPTSGALVEQSCSSTNVWNGDCGNDPGVISNWVPEACYNINPCG